MPLRGSPEIDEGEEQMTQIFCGIDWAEHHHDVALVDDRGNVVARRRITDGFRTLLVF